MGVVGLVEDDLHLGSLDREAHEQARQDLGADALHEADPQTAAIAAGHRLHVGRGDPQRRHHRLGVLEEDGAGGELRGARSIHAFPTPRGDVLALTCRRCGSGVTASSSRLLRPTAVDAVA